MLLFRGLMQDYTRTVDVVDAAVPSGCHLDLFAFSELVTVFFFLIG